MDIPIVDKGKALGNTGAFTVSTGGIQNEAKTDR
jgi:hypothetical protein